MFGRPRESWDALKAHLMSKALEGDDSEASEDDLEEGEVEDSDASAEKS